jgi:hypothetical protein
MIEPITNEAPSRPVRVAHEDFVAAVAALRRAFRFAVLRDLVRVRRLWRRL